MDMTAAIRRSEPAGADAIGTSLGHTRKATRPPERVSGWVNVRLEFAGMQEEPEMAMDIWTLIASPTRFGGCPAGRMITVRAKQD